MDKGLLIVISGPSGAGKGTICRELIKVSDIEMSVSETTRVPRKGEVHGKNYFFVKKENFLKKVKQEGYLEYAEVYGNYYGTPKEFIMNKIESGRSVILEIDFQGALQVKEKYSEAIFIFILPPSMKELKKRIVNRGSETEESFNKRFGNALEEISYIDKYDYCVVNDKVDVAVKKVKTIIEAEHYRVTKEIYNQIEKYKEEIKCSTPQ
ncbi:MAG: guanylate kinase [Clostridia bacterium]|nr:guanylate kinase [Clostridia bacterium]